MKTIRDTPKPKVSVFVLENHSPVEVEISGTISPNGTFSLTTKPSDAHLHLDGQCILYGAECPYLSYLDTCHKRT